MDKEYKKTESDIIDAIIDRPYGFKIGKKHYFLYPATLGKNLVIAPLIQSLGIKSKDIEERPYVEALRLVRQKRAIVLQIIAYTTINEKTKIFDAEYIDKVMQNLSKEGSDTDLATLLVLCLTKDYLYERFIKHTGIDKMLQMKSNVLKAKDSKNTYSFGGKTIYGSIIDSACERYGWTYDYVVWEISLINLRMLMADMPSSVFLTEDERKHLIIDDDESPVIDATDPKNRAKIKEMLKG